MWMTDIGFGLCWSCEYGDQKDPSRDPVEGTVYLLAPETIAFTVVRFNPGFESFGRARLAAVSRKSILWQRRLSSLHSRRYMDDWMTLEMNMTTGI